MIYFMKVGKIDKIKIGYSKNPEKRFINIQNDSPIELNIIKIIRGTRENEKMIHERFNTRRINMFRRM